MTTLHVRGEVDLTTREEFELALERVMDSGSDLVLDLSELIFIDGAGLRTLARTSDRMDRRGRVLRLDRPSPHLRRLLALVDLDYLAA
jgi:anti-anti-sigma factor